ncbi:MAG: PAS domain-containing protein [Alphaproteobacteria bacterium]|nr:PAS domain-containing protein [Alphaproteobacteria bacterium]
MNASTAVPPLIVDPLLRRLYQYWDGERGDHPMPTRGSIDPIKMRYILGHLALIDVLADPRRFRVRLHGTELVSRLGADLTGKTLDEWPSADLRGLGLAWFNAVVERRTPYHQQVNQVIDGFVRNFEALILPYSAQRASVDLILVALRCRDSRSASQTSEACE